MSVGSMPGCVATGSVGTPARIRVVGLLAAGPAATLAAAGHIVSVDRWLEYARLQDADLLVIATAPPEPSAGLLLTVLRQNCPIPALALAADGTVSGRDRVFDVRAAEGTDLTDDAELLMAVSTVLARVDGPPRRGEEPPPPAGAAA